MIRKLLFTVFICSLFTFAKAQSFNLGVGPTIAFQETTFGVQAKLAYYVNDKFHPSATYSYYFKDDTNYAVDVDARYHLFNIEEYRFSPVAGINLARISGTTRVGLNAGLFCEIQRDVISLYIEPKFVLDDVSYFVLSGGLYF
jgi:hypothetical protein